MNINSLYKIFYNDFGATIRLFSLLFIAGICVSMLLCNTKKAHFDLRGVVLATGDFRTLDWARPAHENGGKTIGAHMYP
ncbi:MAG: hypothetical protein LBD59_04635 [Prevotellaceae bacterium]|jgi:hypothetical protein|nr:hypothetical protein [Prevotellaceae bacterium]